MFHHFHDADHGGACRHPAGQGAISAEEFDDLLTFLGRQNILPAREWHRRALTRALRETDLCLTFDDNLRCQYDIALAVMRDRGLTAFFFPYSCVLQRQVDRLEIYRKFRTVCFETIDAFYTAFFSAVRDGPNAQVAEAALSKFNPRHYLVDFAFYSDDDRRFRFLRDETFGPQRYCAVMDAMIAKRGLSSADLAANLWMDAPALRMLAEAGHVIGLHSHTHPTRLERLTPPEQSAEYAKNQSLLEKATGVMPTTMSHPCNSYSTATLEILAALGIGLGFRANMANRSTHPLEHPRQDHALMMQAMRAAA